MYTVTRKQNFIGTSRSTGFTLIELLVVIAIIAILAAILFPVFAAAREKARQTSCLSNEKQINLGMMQYVQDFDECWPGRTVTSNIYGSGSYQSWSYAVQPYIKSTKVWICPDDPTQCAFGGGADFNSSNSIASSYAVVEQFAGVSNPGEAGNTSIMQIGSNGTAGPTMSSQIPEPSNTIWLIESGLAYNSDGTCAYGSPCQDVSNNESHNNPAFYVGNRQNWIVPAKNGTNPISEYHSGGANWAYGDGHVKWAIITSLINLTNSEQDAFIRLKQQGS
jgi:prepilin-type N-terminal cleavage/methylation domain-containing protein/prepilin-type processing-associated H-X9-DG protein